MRTTGVESLMLLPRSSTSVFLSSSSYIATAAAFNTLSGYHVHWQNQLPLQFSTASWADACTCQQLQNDTKHQGDATCMHNQFHLYDLAKLHVLLVDSVLFEVVLRLQP